MLAQCLYLMNGHPLNLSPVSFQVSLMTNHRIPSEKKLSIEKIEIKLNIMVNIFNPIKCLNVTDAMYI